MSYKVGGSMKIKFIRGGLKRPVVNRVSVVSGLVAQLVRATDS